MKLPYKGGGVALFYKDKHTGEYSILLGKRTIEPGKGKWSIPGGGYEPPLPSPPAGWAGRQSRSGAP